jgi:hypothetical protein
MPIARGECDFESVQARSLDIGKNTLPKTLWGPTILHQYTFEITHVTCATPVFWCVEGNQVGCKFDVGGHENLLEKL